jgi:hypothetical protein
MKLEYSLPHVVLISMYMEPVWSGRLLRLLDEQQHQSDDS